MRRYMALLLALVCALSLGGCGNKGNSYTIEIVIPAGSTEAFVYSDEDISPQRNTLTISAGAGISAMEVILKTVAVKEENAYEPATLTQKEPVKMDVEKGGWFKIGVGMQNPSDRNITVAVKVENVDIIFCGIDVWFHFWIPTTFLMTEMDAVFKKFFH